ncbi:hypothetical protein HU762_24580 [Pseudomonas sp. SWRI92]|uniref:hypothetical protein n=1 Tax=Pseudomonas sp. SWRI92 TaxID=2745499 RepID=UPI001645B1EA|nr:hypothetical protein [Pseudomonas sp. SWRI92]MBC3377122.1 hypothetical protein [Pseudomonas sp. SWRI92]
MVLSVSSAYIPPANTNLTRSEQPLVTQAPTDAAKLALSNASPAAIFHPSEEAQSTMPMPVVIETWVGRSQSPDFPRYAEILKGATSTLKSSFEDFQSALSATHPDLAGKKYGFTVDADGSLKVLNTGGKLSSTDIQRLTDLLNDSKDLKAAAIAVRDASIDLVDADSPWSGSYLGLYSLTKENFANTIDLAPLLKDRGSVSIQEYSDGLFFNQLAYKGERATRETEQAMFERRAAERFSAQA